MNSRLFEADNIDTGKEDTANMSDGWITLIRHSVPQSRAMPTRRAFKTPPMHNNIITPPIVPMNNPIPPCVGR